MGTISLEQGDRLYWLGRYTERVFTTLRVLQRLCDKMTDNTLVYTQYLAYWGLDDVYANDRAFIRSFLYDIENPNSVAFSLEKAYDNGVVLREKIPSEALSFLQLVKDLLHQSERSENARLSLLPLEDQLFGFGKAISENVYDDEIKNLIYCGKTVERLDFYFHMRYPFDIVKREFNLLCQNLYNIPKNAPYSYNIKCLVDLVEIIGTEEDYLLDVEKAIASLNRLFQSAGEALA